MKKMPGDIIILHMCTINDNHMMYGFWDMEHDEQNFFVILKHFCTFTPLNNPKNQNLKKWKNRLEILSFYTCVLKMRIIWCLVREILSATDRTFCHFGPFSPFYSLNNLKNENFEKMKKSLGDIIIFTHVYHKWQS